MRCRIHPSDPGAGVCACCLRERLSNLFTAPANEDSLSSPAIPQNTEPSSAPPLLPHFRSEHQGSFAADRCCGNKKPCPKKSKSDTIIPKPLISNSRPATVSLWQKKKNKKKTNSLSPSDEEIGRGRWKKDEVKAQRQPSPSKFSGYSLCLKPLVRPSPGNQRNHSSETDFTGELRGTINQRCGGGGGGGAGVPGTSSGLISSRSRKLVDLGKVW